MAFNANDTIENMKKLIADQAAQDKRQDEDMKRLNPPPAAAPATDGSAAGDESADPPNTIYSLDDFLKRQKDVEWFIQGIVQKNALMMLFGSSGSGKTFAALDMGLSIATQEIDTWHPYRSSDRGKIDPQITHGSVLYLTGEGEHGLRKRLAAWIQDRRTKYPAIDSRKINFHVGTFEVKLNESDGERTLMEAIKAHTQKIPGGVPNLIILDTLIYYMNGDENSTQDARGLVDACQRVRKHLGDCSIMLIHHTGKDPEKQDDARGSSAFRGALDVQIKVTGKITDGASIITLTQTKNKDDEELTVYTVPRFVEMADEREGHELDGKKIRSVVLTDSEDDPTRERIKARPPAEHKAIVQTWHAAQNSPEYEIKYKEECRKDPAGHYFGHDHIGITYEDFLKLYKDPEISGIETTKNLDKAFAVGINWLLDNEYIQVSSHTRDGAGLKNKRFVIHDSDREYADRWIKGARELAQESKGQAAEERQDPPNAELFEPESPEGYSPTPKATKPKGKKKRS